LLETGLRIGDAAGLKRDRIEGNKLRLRTEKTGTPVCILLSEHLLSLLDKVVGTNQLYFFWSGQGHLKSCIGDWQRSLKKLFRIAEVPNAFGHRFRHTFAKRCLNAGVPPERVATLLGHRSPAITLNHYAAWIPERQEQLDKDVRKVQLKFVRYSLDGSSNAN
jgi:integrase